MMFNILLAQLCKSTIGTIKTDYSGVVLYENIDQTFLNKLH